VTWIAPSGLKLIKLLKVLEAGAKKPRVASICEEEGVTEKVAVNPFAGDAGKLTR
jgi:hypothetical protein